MSHTSSYEHIIYEVDDPVATITLNRPESLNAWTPTMDRELRDAVSSAAVDRAVVGIIVTGAGRAFCAGADMEALNALSSANETAANDTASGDSGGHRADERAPHKTESKTDEPVGDFDGRLMFPMAIDKPVIAAVNGAVAGMAFPLALACDLRVATRQALFVTAFAQRGLIAEWGLSWLLPKLVGPSVALDLLITSRRVYGEEAHQLGLVNYLVEPDELLRFCRRYIEQLANQCSPRSIAVMKRQVYEQMHRGLGPAELDSRRLMRESFERPDFAEGVQSFLQNRPPQFSRLPAE